MKSIKLFVSFLLVIAVFAGQVSAVFAASELITGTVHSVTLETNANTAVTTVIITLLDNEESQNVRITIESAISLGLVILGGDGNPIINEAILGQLIEIEPTTVINNEQNQHPVGDALATFFSDIGALDYETIMTVHDGGTGFGVIAQALWLTRKLDGNSEVFLAIINAKRTKDYSAFVFKDGITPANWGQFKKAVLDGKNGKLGIVLTDNDGDVTENGTSNPKEKIKNKDKNKQDKENKGNGKDK